MARRQTISTAEASRAATTNNWREPDATNPASPHPSEEQLAVGEIMVLNPLVIAAGHTLAGEPAYVTPSEAKRIRAGLTALAIAACDTLTAPGA